MDWNKYAAEREVSVPLTNDEWAKEYALVKETPPTNGDFLRTEDKQPIKLYVTMEAGKPPFIFGRAYVSSVIGNAPEWYMQSMGRDFSSYFGYKCILLPKSRDEVLARAGAVQFFGVKELQVVRPSIKKTALMVEVSEW